MNRIYLTLILFFSLFSSISLAQKPNSFPTDSIGFFDVMEDFISGARDEGKSFMKQFEDIWFGGYFSETERQGVYEMTNKMLEKKMRAFPDFRNYLYSVGSFVVYKDSTDGSFVEWQNTLAKLLDDRNRRNFGRFLEFSNNLFMDNSLAVSPSTIWKANNNKFTFGFDSLPKITFDSLDLICIARTDSMKILNTSGVFYPTEDKWVGKDGIVTWERAGFSPGIVYAELGAYIVNTRYNEYTADSVQFHYPDYFDQPLLGVLKDKALANMTAEKASYPRFDSYARRLRIEDIAPDVNYDGGFSMVGNKILGMGTEEELAMLEFFRNDTLFLLVSTEVFSIRPERIVSERAAIKFYLKDDSITHPGLNFRFSKEDQKVTLYKNNKGIAKAPYDNTYHNIEMDFEALYWKQNEPMMTISSLIGSTKDDAIFISANYFKQEQFDQLGVMADVNPLYSIKSMVDAGNSTTLSITQLGYNLNMEHTDAKNMVMWLSTMGFMEFDFDKDLFYVDQKLIDYVMASQKRTDYDVLNVYSEVKDDVNAKINLLNYDLTINGVKGIILSDSQKVVIIPSNGQIKMQQNRLMEFGGIVAAGKFSFFGKQFNFDYDQFKIDLINVDSLSILAETTEKDRYGLPVLKPVKTVIEDIKGDLLIDHPTNKSGLKNYPQYPIFNSTQNSYVYYDDKNILNGVYKKNNFYFQINPYQIDSLDNFDNSQLNFAGTFSSASIFPDFEESLTLQADHSLGFQKDAPVGGFPVYGGKGTFNDKIYMSNKGLRGDGNIKYLTSTTYSNDFVFYPDSMLARSQEFFIEEKLTATEYPTVKGNDLGVRWLPYKDVMHSKTNSEKMVFYNDSSYFDGTTSLTPNYLKGNGAFHFVNANIQSKDIRFKSVTFDADTAAFQLRDIAEEAFAIRTDNVKAHVDLENRFAQFESNGGAAPIEFPINQYLCYMESFKWYMDNNNIELSSSSSTDISADVNLEGSKFISTNPKQDSLFFYSPLATYNTRDHIIAAEQVEFILTADAKVVPDSGKVVIHKKAKMDPLRNSRIIANSVTEHHHIYDATTNIYGRKNYSASGYIDYINDQNIPQKIFFAHIYVDTTGQTIGKGKILDSASFVLSSHFAFQGGVNLSANREFLVFNGAVKMNHDCKALDNRWIVFENEIDPHHIYIPIDSQSVDTMGMRLMNSIALNTDSTYMYPGFLTYRRNYSDIKLAPATGFLTYHQPSKEYRISSKDKIEENSLSGNYMSLETSSCKVRGEGMIDLGERTGNLDFVSAGNMVFNTIENELILDLISTLDFFFDDNAIKIMAEHINENINLQATSFTRETYQKGLRELLGEKEAEEILSELNLNYKMKKIPDMLDKRFVFTDLKFKWNELENAYESFGKIGIGNINKLEINKYVDGLIRIEKKRSGDIVDIYLELDENNWYYFNYRRGVMKTVSSNEEFNTRIKELDLKDRKYNNKKGEENFLYMFTSDRMKINFERDYLEE